MRTKTVTVDQTGYTTYYRYMVKTVGQDLVMTVGPKLMKTLMTPGGVKSML